MTRWTPKTWVSRDLKILENWKIGVSYDFCAYGMAILGVCGWSRVKPRKPVMGGSAAKVPGGSFLDPIPGNFVVFPKMALLIPA